jgi:riboflavin synthase
MFTGLIHTLGEITHKAHSGASEKDVVFTIAPLRPDFPLEIGASIACHGICLTVTGILPDGRFTATASEETMARTNAAYWQVGTRINLEPSLRVGDRLGGHFVSGHVDGVGRVRQIRPAGDSAHWQFDVPKNLMPMIAVKGSIAIDGVSLTVNTVDAEGFGVTIIPHTRDNTHFADLQQGDAVHLEVDMLARYVARLQEAAA